MKPKKLYQRIYEYSKIGSSIIMDWQGNVIDEKDCKVPENEDHITGIGYYGFIDVLNQAKKLGGYIAGSNVKGNYTYSIVYSNE